MEVGRSAIIFLTGVVRRAYYLLPAFLVDPFNFYENIVKSSLPTEYQFELSLPSHLFPYLLIVGVLWAAVLTYHDLRMRTINFEDDLAGRRAYISFKAAGFHAMGPDDSTRVDSYDFVIAWENSGPTPARRYSTGVNLTAFTDDIPEDFDYPDLGSPHPPGGDIGPSQEIHVRVPVTAHELWQVESENLKIYVWAWVEYDDIFPESERHRTEACVKLTAVGNAMREGATLNYIKHTKFNGSDKDCYRQPQT